MAHNIILIGMPGCGKSTIGTILARILPHYTLFDIDSIIEKTIGMSIAEYFKKYSEDEFRKLEYDTIKSACSGQNRIVSIGGGAFENPDNRATLLNFGKVFYLKTNLDVLYYRLSNDKIRPLLQNGNVQDTLKNMLKKREANYLKAHVTIDTDELGENEIIETILGSIDEASS